MNGWLAAPLIVPQALWVAARATRLPEAAGPRQGRTGQGPRLRVLILGDSSAAGVGVATQEAALAGQVVAALAAGFTVEWRLVARSGATVARAAEMLTREPDARFDAVLLALGVNDTKNGVRQARFEAGYAALLEVLRARFGARHLVLSGIPPMGRLPILPRPLRDVLGARAVAFDAVLQHLAQAEDVTHLPMGGEIDAGLMAEDGFHPGARLYASWGARAADAIRRRA